HQVEEMVVEVSGATVESRNLLRRPTLDDLKRGDAALTLPVALCNHQIVAVTGRDRLEGDLLNLGGLVMTPCPPKRPEAREIVRSRSLRIVALRASTSSTQSGLLRRGAMMAHRVSSMLPA